MLAIDRQEKMEKLRKVLKHSFNINMEDIGRIKYVPRETTQSFSKPVQSFAKSCVQNYAEFDGDQYVLEVDQLPEDTQEEFAAVIMQNDDDRANEATGADNDAFQRYMMPALIKHLTNPLDKDLQIDFMNAWRKGVTEYNKHYMQRLINDALSDYNAEERACVHDWEDYYGTRSNRR